MCSMVPNMYLPTHLDVDVSELRTHIPHIQGDSPLHEKIGVTTLKRMDELVELICTILWVAEKVSMIFNVIVVAKCTSSPVSVYIYDRKLHNNKHNITIYNKTELFMIYIYITITYNKHNLHFWRGESDPLSPGLRCGTHPVCSMLPRHGE